MANHQKHIKLLQQIFEFTFQVILVLNDDKLITKANPAAQKLFGFDEKELENKSIHTIIPELSKKNNSEIDQHITSLWVTKKDGTQSLVNIQLSNNDNDQNSDTVLFIQDATDSLIYKWALKENKEELSNIESEGKLGNWYWVFDTDERYWSDEFYRICGLSPGDNRLNAETALTFIHPDDRKVAIEVVTETIEKHIPYNIEKRIIQPDGTVRNVIARGKIDYSASGSPMRMSGTMKDITQLKNKQNALLESNRKYQTLINNLSGIVYSCENNLEYAMHYINDGCFGITGYTSDEFLKGAVHFRDIILDEDRVYVSSEIQKAISQKSHYDLQYRIESKEGSIKYVREIGCGVYNHNHITLEGFITDQTEPKKTQALLEIRNRALEAAGSGILIADAQKPNQPIVYCNQAFTKITGYTADEVLGKNCQFLQSDDQDQPQIKTMREAIQQGEACRVTLRNYRKDGSQFWNDVSITPVKDKTGKTTHFIGVQNDITKQKKAEEKLFNSEVRNNAILKALPDLLFVINKEGMYIDMHVQDTSILAAPITEIIGRNISDILPKTLCTKIMAAFRNCEKTKEIQIFEYPITIEDQPKHFEARIVQTEKNNFLTIIRDISQEKIIADKLKETQEQLNAYTKDLEEKVKERTSEVTATVEQLVTTNLNLQDQIKETQAAEKRAVASKSLSSAIAKNFPRGFIIVFNTNFEMILKEGQAIDYLGLKKVIYEGMAIDDIKIFSETEKVKLKEDVLNTLKGEHLSFELVYKKKHFLVNTTPLFGEGNTISNALFVYSDITQQKKVEQVAQKALIKEQELNELKSRFISMASHEFRTPLSAIQTSAILIGKQNESGKEEKREKYVRQIKNNVKHLVVILNDFLSLSKLEEGKVTAKSELLDIVDFSKSLIEEVSITTKEGQNIQFSGSNKNHSLQLDHKLLRHILMNLLSNAVKYSPEHTTINFNIEEDAQYITIGVSDQGIGIPEEEQKNLFERFFRAKNAHNIEGTGLGLNIVKQYVTLMDGNIDFKSETNKGTTFWIKFPKLNKQLQ